MNKIEYAKYLKSLMDGPEIDLDSDELADQFYGFFQCFMPRGEGIEKIFEPLRQGKELLQRLVPIFEVTHQKTQRLLDNGVMPGYFCPEADCSEELLKKLGEQYIQDLRKANTFFKEPGLGELLNKVTEIEIIDDEPEVSDNYLNDYLSDVISDWAIANEDDADLTSLLCEAYYSINCDNYLGYYLRYPIFKKKPKNDFLKSYYEIWKHGYYCIFDAHKLIIYS